MDRFVAHNSRWRVAGLILLSLGFMAAGLWMAGAFGAVPESRKFSPSVTVALGWFAFLFFGTCAWFGVKKLRDQGAQLEVGPEGILYAPWSDRLIPWSEIIDVTTWSMRQQQMIVLHLAHPEHFPGKGLAGRIAGANKALTGGDITISMTGTDRRFDETLAAITWFRDAR